MEKSTEPPVKKQKIEYADVAPTTPDLDFLRRLPFSEQQCMDLIPMIPNRVVQPVLKRERTITEEN